VPRSTLSTEAMCRARTPTPRPAVELEDTATTPFGAALNTVCSMSQGRARTPMSRIPSTHMSIVRAFEHYNLVNDYASLSGAEQTALDASACRIVHSFANSTTQAPFL
jgi:hypothetical protein